MVPSNPGSSSNMCFVRQTITKMADKMAATYQFASIRCCGHSNLVIFNRISSKFIYGLLTSNPGSSLNMCFVRQKIIKIADKMAAAYHFASIPCYGHCYLVIFNWISSKFNIWIASIKPWFKFKYEFCPTYNNEDGRQNGSRLSLCIQPLLCSL